MSGSLVEIGKRVFSDSAGREMRRDSSALGRQRGARPSMRFRSGVSFSAMGLDLLFSL